MQFSSTSAAAPLQHTTGAGQLLHACTQQQRNKPDPARVVKQRLFLQPGTAARKNIQGKHICSGPAIVW
jgi:hypothetical protein